MSIEKEMALKEKAQIEFAGKRKLMEEALIEKLLRKLPHKLPIQVDDVVFKVGIYGPLGVVKIEEDYAEVIRTEEVVIPTETERGSKTISMLKFKISELWHEDDFLPIEEEVVALTDQEVSAKLSGFGSSLDSIN